MTVLNGSPLLLREVAAASGDDYQIQKSLKFHDSDSSYLSRYTTLGNLRTWTLSFWVKRGKLTSNMKIFSNNNTGGNGLSIEFGGTDIIWIGYYNGSAYDLLLSSNAKYRDPNAWMHIVVGVDTTRPAPVDRFKLWINGELNTAWTGSYPDQNTELPFNKDDNNYPLTIGTNGANKANYYDGYLADVNFIDGLQLTPDSFGKWNTNGSRVWDPKEFSIATPNGGTTWSNETWKYVSDNSTVSWSGALSRAFKGYVGGSNAYASTGNDVYWEPSVDLPLTNSLSIWADYNYVGVDPIEVHTDAGTAYTRPYSSGWASGSVNGSQAEIICNIPPDSTKLTKLVIPDQGSSINLNAFVVDGIHLTDGQTDKTYLQWQAAIPEPINNGTVWSSYTTGTVINSSYAVTKMFDGNVPVTSDAGTEATLGANGQTMVWKTTGGLTADKIEIKIYRETYGDQITLNGTNIKSAVDLSLIHI